MWYKGSGVGLIIKLSIKVYRTYNIKAQNVILAIIFVLCAQAFKPTYTSKIITNELNALNIFSIT
jgi:hypothetical protein